MTKPRKKSKSGSRRKSKPVAPKPVDVVEAAPPPSPVEPAPQTDVEELRQEIAAFDHDGDGHPGGSLPHSAEQGPDAEQPAEATEVAAAPAESAEEAEAAEPAPAAPFRKCMVGPVEARIGRVPLGAVLGLLDPDGLRRIEAEKSTASFEATCKRLLATDGQATPVVFSQTYDKTEQPNILHGYQELAAAEASGVNDVTVILIPPGGASEAQSHIVEMVRQQRTSAQPATDDELFYRVHAEG